METTGLKKTVGYWTALGLSVGSIAGTTLFFGHSIGSKVAGNLFIIGLVVLGLLSVYIATLFAELVSMFPRAGGAYEFTKQAYNHFFSFVIGWAAWITGTLSVVVVIAGAVTGLLPSLDTFTAIAAGIGFIIFLNIIAYIGIEAGGFVLILFSLILIGVIAVASGIGFFSFEINNLLPIITHPFTTIGLIIFFIIESYFGWEGAAYLAEETKNAEKIIPRAIVHGTIIVAVLSILSGIAFLGALGWETGSLQTNPLGTLVALHFGEVGLNVLNIFIFISLLGVAAGAVITMPRLLLALARDKLFLGQFKEIHSHFRTPYKAIIFQTVILIFFLFLGFGNYERLLNLLLPLSLFVYFALILAVPILRWKKPDTPRPFRAPFGKVGPIIIAILFIGITSIWLFTQQGAFALFRLSLSILGLGLPLYLLVSSYYDTKAITRINDMFANIIIKAEKIMTQREFKKNILSFFGDISEKKILELGCSEPITTSLLQKVGPAGKVYVVHFSKKHLSIIKEHAERAEWETERTMFGQLIPIQDAQYYKRIHPAIQEVDGMVSIGMLGYIQDMESMLENLKKVVPIGGRIVFAEYSNFFHLLPEVEWLGNQKKIEKLFRKHGFSVRIQKKHRILWNSIYLYGIRYSEDVAII